MSLLERRAVWIAVGLALLHAGLAFGYAAITPYLQPGVSNGQLLEDIGAPDEFAHAAYVQHILLKDELPVLRPGTEEARLLYEAHQPPLFYALDALWLRVLGTDILEGPGIAPRSLNALFGAVTVLGAFFLALWSTRRHSTALFCAATAALLPMLGALDGAVSNDPLLILLCTWTLALMIRWNGTWTPSRCLLAGALVGLAILTKSTGLLLVPVLAWAIWAGGKARPMNLLAAGVAVLLIGGPWLVRNQLVYGDPLGMSAFYAVFERHTSVGEVFSGPRELVRWLYVLCAGTGLSTVGIFGYMDIHLSYRLYVPILALLVLGLAAAIVARRAGPVLPTGARGPAGLFAALVVLGYVSYNLWQIQPQARYLFPALGLWVLWTVAGLERLWPKRAFVMPSVLCLLFFAANISAIRLLPGEFKARTDAAKARGATSPLRKSPSI